MSRKLTTEEFIEKAKKIHGDKFDYSKTNYTGAKNLITIGCPVHGDVLISGDAHGNQGQGCGKCRGHSIHLGKKFSNDKFIEMAKSVHGDKFDYSLVEYVNNTTKVKIGCNVHGMFEQRPADHLYQTSGCPRCMRNGFNKSKPGFLYVLTADNLTKVGITNRSVAVRTRELARNTNKPYKIAASFSFEDGTKAADIELAVLNQLRQEFNNPTEIFDGSTETFVDLPPEVAIKKIAQAISPSH